MRASNKFAKVSTDDITNKLIANQSVHKDDRNIVKNRVKTFFYDLSKRQSHSEKPLAVVRKAETSPLTQTHSHHLSLVNVCHDTRRRRISPIIAYLEAEAENQKCTLNQLLGLIIKQGNYIHDRDLSDLGEKLINQFGGE